MRAHPRPRAPHGSRTGGGQHRWSSNRAPARAWVPDRRFHCVHRLGGGGPAARTAHARACTTRHATPHRFAGWCGISGRRRSRRFRSDVLQAVHSQLRRLRRAAAGGQPARRRRCGRAGRGASLLQVAAALGEEVRALSQRGDGEARGALGRAGRSASLLPAAAALGEEVHALSQCGDGEARGALVALVARVAQR